MASATILMVGGTPASATAVNTNFGELNDRFLDAGTSHFHNGVDSEKVKVTLLNADTLTEGDVLQVVSGTAVAGSAQFNVLTGHRHDGTDSRFVYATNNIDIATLDAGPLVIAANSTTTIKTWTITFPDENCSLTGFISTGTVSQYANNNIGMDYYIRGVDTGWPPISSEFQMLQEKWNTGGTQPYRICSMEPSGYNSFPVFPNGNKQITITFKASNGDGTHNGTAVDLSLKVFWLGAGTATIDSGRIA